MSKFGSNLKEIAIFLAANAEASCFIRQCSGYQPHGVAYAKTFTYSVCDLQITYDKWIVENFEVASKMNLDGCKYNDRLINGVFVISKKLGTRIFYGNDANEIVSACERRFPNQIAMVRNSRGIIR